MSDRTLLEFAAKAAGLWDAANNCIDIPWNLLSDDGDALRLAVKLQLQVTPGTYDKDEFTAYRFVQAKEYWSPIQDEAAATRRAIVRAAAEIGKAMP